MLQRSYHSPPHNSFSIKRKIWRHLRHRHFLVMKWCLYRITVLSQKVRILYSSNCDRVHQKFNMPRTYSLGQLQCGLLKQRNSEHSLNVNKQHFQSKGSQFCANGKMQWEREPLLAYMSIGHKKALFCERCNSEILRKANQKEFFLESLSIRLLQNLFVMLKRSFRLLNYLGWSGITRSEHVGLLLKPF